MAEHALAVLLEMLAEADRAAGRRIVEAAGEQGLAFDQRRSGEIVAVEVEEVEGVEDHALGPAGLQGLLQAGEDRHPGFVLDHHLAVDQRRAELQLFQSGSDAAELRRPVQTLAGEELDPVSVDTGLQAVAVELDLVDPFVALRGLGGRGGKARLQEDREQALLALPAPAPEQAGSSYGRPSLWRGPRGPLGQLRAPQARRWCVPRGRRSAPPR